MHMLPAASLLLVGVLLLAPSAPAWADEESPAGDVQQGVTPDPWERMNRPVFAFNEGVDRWVLEPVATGWDWAVPEVAQTSVGNFFEHLTLPVHFVNDVLQLKPRAAYETLWRVVINSVVGLGGLFDPASSWEVPQSDEDFGQTLGYWGVPPGPYWVIPFLGPSSPRDAGGLVVDAATFPIGFVVPIYVTVPANAVNIVNARAAVLEDIRAERAAAFDFYSFVRSSYTQFRENRVRDRAEDEEDEDLYYFDEEDE